MSVVGPRPERPVFVEQFRQTVPGYMLRHKVKSGITGWAQVHALPNFLQQLVGDLRFRRGQLYLIEEFHGRLEQSSRQDHS